MALSLNYVAPRSPIGSCYLDDDGQCVDRSLFSYEYVLLAYPKVKLDAVHLKSYPPHHRVGDQLGS